MHCSLTKMEFESLIHSEFENRFTGVKIPELEIILTLKATRFQYSHARMNRLTLS